MVQEQGGTGHGGGTQTGTPGAMQLAGVIKGVVAKSGGNISPELRKSYYEMVTGIAGAFQSTPNFNKEDFYRACGVSPEWQQAAA